MTLLELRTLFRNLSGRYDLVNADFSDNGADFFINEGRKYLDRLDDNQKTWASCYRTILTDAWSTSFPHCRAIKEVWVASATERWQLDKKRLQDLVAGYMTALPTARSSGTPLYYSPCITRFIPEDSSPAYIASFAPWTDVIVLDGYEYNAILLNVPTSEDLVVTINGLFYSAELVDNADENYWSAIHPMLLYMSAMRQIEVVNRNTQGVNDWTTSIQTEIQQLGFDLVEEAIAEIDQMEG